MTTVCVIGSTGFIGTFVCEALEASGVAVRRIRAPRLTHTGSIIPAEIVRDYRSVINELAEQLIGVDAVVNAAGDSNAASRDRAGLMGANALLPALVAIACEQAQVPRLVHLSSAAVQGRMPELNETLEIEPFSEYSRSKAEGERLVLQIRPRTTTVYRPPGVHAASRRVTQTLTKIATSPLSTVPGEGNDPSPQALAVNVGSAIAFLAVTPQLPPPVVTHPSEGLTTRSVLELLGGREPRSIPRIIARVLVRVGRSFARGWPALSAHVRRVEMVWFGQRQSVSWLTSPGGWEAVVGHEGWRDLGREVRSASSGPTAHDSDNKRPTILFGVTTGMSVKGFFSGQFAMLRQAGWDVVLVTTDEGDARMVAEREGATFVEITATRDPSPRMDARTLWALLRILREIRPTIAVWGTPKVGLLGTLASRLTRVTNLYVLHGLRLETAVGPQQRLLTWCERVAAASAHEVVAVSHDLRHEAIERHLAPARKIRVLGPGSANGVEFHPRRENARSRLGLPEDQPIVSFVGRLTKDKGMLELLTAWRDVQSKTGAVLALAGMREPDADQDPLRSLIHETPGVIELGHLDDLTDLYSATDLLVLPSHREGYPTVVLEAATFGIPAVVSNATGVRESVVDGVTGLMFDVKDTAGLTRVLLELLEDPTRRATLGDAARRHARTYERPTVHRRWREYFTSMMQGAQS
ncbi:glycosyltransferase [Janibacter indicus]|uniref:D-inositol 3-phosphate glycosyltransferase n=1 Tax=Janibacter indicus TaxID=857417 RepID=A0A1W1Y533_9MICO|nr:glycosyltransferase [Janibacter indicus]SMC31276.1 Glycosyltransferase involved in cell wall bisynthesis [Janibacter indicus]